MATDSITPSSRIRDVFAQLQSIYTELQKQGDSLELVLGCAILQDDQNIYQHPLIIKPIQIFFNGLNNQLTIENGSQPCELYTELLHELNADAHLVLNTWREQIQTLHPLDETARIHSQVMQNWLQNQPNHTLRFALIMRLSFLSNHAHTGTVQFADSIINDLEKHSLDALPFYLKRLSGLINHPMLSYDC
jgi:hypothetical protein